MRELSLFSGGGGGLLASKHLLNHTILGYVENNEYCQRIISARIVDGLLDDAPIFGDIRTFINDGFAASYTGMVDLVSGGFPCQPFSCAGKQLGADDPRNMWPATAHTLRIIRPEWAFLENVPGLLNNPYFEEILADLAEMGMDVGWGVWSAADAGAPHLRKRLWIMAHTQYGGRERWNTPRKGTDSTLSYSSDALAYSTQHGRITWRKSDSTQGPGGRQSNRGSQCKDEMADATRIQQRREEQRSIGERIGECRQPKYTNTWWESEPNVGRVAHGVASRVDRLKAIGNGQVPAVAAGAFKFLKSLFEEGIYNDN